MKRIITILLVLVLLVAVAAVVNGGKKKTEPVVITEYDVLQKMFIGLSADTTAEALEEYIAENDLKYKRDEKRREVIYTAGVVYEEGNRHPFKGDKVEVCFEIESGSLEYAVYTHGFVSAVLYCSGTYWDLQNGSEQGYYGDVIGEHNFEKVESAESAIQYVFEHQEK